MKKNCPYYSVLVLNQSRLVGAARIVFLRPIQDIFYINPKIQSLNGFSGQTLTEILH